VPLGNVHVCSWTPFVQRDSRLWGPSLNVDYRLGPDKCLRRFASAPPSARGWALIRAVDGSEAGLDKYMAWCVSNAKAGALKVRLNEREEYLLMLMPASEARCAEVGAAYQANELLLLMVLVKKDGAAA
jgi:hypothetical protein